MPKSTQPEIESGTSHAVSLLPKNSPRTMGLICLLLGLILASAAFFRFYGLAWDSMQHLHPDERFLTMVTASLEPANSFSAYLDTAHSPLNPLNRGHRFYIYGTFPLFLVRFLCDLFDRTGFDQITMMGRQVSALADFSTLILLCFLGLRLFGVRIALLATALGSWTVLLIQQAHFYTVDSLANFFATAVLLCLAHTSSEEKWWPWGWGGIALGLGLACKVSLWPLAAFFPLAAWLQIPPEFPIKKIQQWASKLLLGGLAAFLLFRLFQPYAFTGPHLWNIGIEPQWWQNLEEARRLVNGEIDFPPGHQWTNRPPIVFPLLNMVIWGMGIPLGVAALAGWGWMGWSIFRGRDWRRHLLLWLWISSFFLYQGSQWVKSMRYLLPVYPGLILCAAWGLACFCRGAAWRRRLAWGAGAVVLAGTLCWAIAYVRIYSQPSTRVAASRWIFAHLPPQFPNLVAASSVSAPAALSSQGLHPTVIGNEHWDDSLPLRLDGKTADQIYQGLILENYDEDTPQKLERLLGWLDRADYLVLSSNRLYASIPRLPLRYPMTSEYYRALLSGRLGFLPVAEFSSHISIGPFYFPDQESTEALGIANPFDQKTGQVRIGLPPAEEAFSVYDHPRVIILKKTTAFSREGVREILGRFNLNRTLKLSPRAATAAPGGLQMDQVRWQGQQESGTWRRLYARASFLNRTPAAAVIGWWALLTALGLIAWPIVYLAWPDLPDCGWGFARIFALLITAYVAWLLASWGWIPFSKLSLSLALTGIILSGLAMGRKWYRPLSSFFRREWRLLLAEEAVFLLAGAFFLLVRYFNSDLWHPTLGGERPMDFAHFNAILKATFFPPYDPWFAGGLLNYYYFGYVMAAVPVKLLGIIPSISYNLVLAMLAALTAQGAFSLGYNFTALVPQRPRAIAEKRHPLLRLPLRAGLFATVFTLFLGNLGELELILRSVSQLSPLRLPPGMYLFELPVQLVHGLWLLAGGHSLSIPLDQWYWHASRLLNPGEINEFPFFTFLFGDLHPHLMAIPLFLLMLGTGLGWVLRASWRGWPSLLSLGAGALVVGASRATHSWDYPTCLLIAFLAFAVNGWRAERLKDRAFSLASGVLLFGLFWISGAADNLPTLLLLGGIFLVVPPWIQSILEPASSAAWRNTQFLWLSTAILSLLLFSSFRSSFATAYQSLELWKGATTPLGPFFLAHGIFLFLLACSLGGEVLQWKRQWWQTAMRWRAGWLWAFGFLAMVFLLLIQPRPVVLLLAPLFFLSGLLLSRRNLPGVHRFLLGLLLLAFTILFSVEVLVLRGDVGRMNTVFKFYLPAWVLLSLASAVYLARSMEVPLPPFHRFSARITALSLIGAGLLYPLLATRAKIMDRFNPGQPPGLDSLQFMTAARLDTPLGPMNLNDEYQALLWMQAHVQGTPVVAEAAAAPPYRSLLGRVATYTGLPVPIGYEWHQRQQRSVLPEGVVQQRVADMNRLFSTVDIAETRELIAEYQIQYIIVGETERRCYPVEGLKKLEQMAQAGMMKVVYRNAEVILYEVTSPPKQSAISGPSQ